MSSFFLYRLICSGIQWLMALVEVFGIWLIAMNPLDVYRKKKNSSNETFKLLNYGILNI